jgi:hypothetical protein
VKRQKNVKYKKAVSGLSAASEKCIEKDAVYDRYMYHENRILSTDLNFEQK